MHVFIKIIVVLLLSTVNTVAFAQSKACIMETLGTRDGLLSPKIYALLQNTERKLFVGNELGLSIYDGYGFKNFQYTSNNSIIGRIRAIAEDSTHTIWIGGDRGLFFIDDDMVYQVHFKGDTTLAIESLFTSSNGQLWVGELNDFYVLDAVKVMVIVKQNKIIPRAIVQHIIHERVFSITEHSNTLFVGVYGTIFSINIQDKKLTRFWSSTSNPLPITGIVSNNSNTLLFGGPNIFPHKLAGRKLQEFKQPSLMGSVVIPYKDNACLLNATGVYTMDENGINALITYNLNA